MQRAVTTYDENRYDDDLALFREYGKTKDIALRNKLIEKYLYIAEIMAKKFVGKGVEYDDLFQVSSLALIKAIDRFDAKKGVKFSTFATPSILGEIKNYFRDKSRLIKPGRKNNALIQKIHRAKEEFKNKYNRSPNAEELAGILKTDIDSIIEAMEYNSSVLSLDSNIDDSDTSLYEVIPDTENVFEKFDDLTVLRQGLDSLSPLERDVIEKRFFKNKSQSELAREMNVSQMFISRLERKIIGKLKNMFEIT